MTARVSISGLGENTVISVSEPHRFSQQPEKWLNMVSFDDVEVMGEVEELATCFERAAASLRMALAEAIARETGAEVTHLPPGFTDAELAEAFRVDPAEDPALEPCEVAE